MNRLYALPLAALLLCGGLLSAQGNPRTLRVVALQITHPPAKEDAELSFGSNHGTHIDLIVHLPGKRILALDADGSKLTRFTDDKKTDLSQSDGFSWLTDTHSRISPDGTRMGFQIRSTAVPAVGATRLRIQGTIVLMLGSEEKTAEVKDVTLKADGSIKVGPAEIRKSKDEFGKAFESGLEEMAGAFLGAFFGGEIPKKKGPPGLEERVALTHSQPNIKSVVFLDKDGKVVPSESVGSSWASAFGGPRGYTTEYRVKGKIEKATVRVTYFNKIQPMKVPLDLEIGVGF
jgi:hypothetical protein